MTIKNIFLQAIKPKRFFVMLKKVLLRIFDKKGPISNDENLKWLKKNQ